MKYLRQFGILLAVTFAGEILNYALPLPIPASVYGIILLFVLLLTGVVKKEWIKDVTAWLIGIMPILFVAPTVGLIDAWGVLKPVIVQYVLLCLVITVVIMGVSGRVTQAVIRRSGRNEKALPEHAKLTEGGDGDE